MIHWTVSLAAVAALFHFFTFAILVLVVPQSAMAQDPPRFIVIASGMRSGSTELERLISSHPCVHGFNEFFNNAVSGDGKPQSGWASRLLSEELFASRQHHAVEALATVQRGVCGIIDKELTSRGQRACDARCAIVFKLFDTHHVPPSQIAALFRHNGTTVVTLERRPRGRRCSLAWALQQEDWGTSPGANHHVNRSACAKLSDFDKFEAEHNAWFAFLRCLVRQEEAVGIELPFSVATDPARAPAAIDAIWAATGLPLHGAEGGLQGHDLSPEKAPIKAPHRRRLATLHGIKGRTDDSRGDHQTVGGEGGGEAAPLAFTTAPPASFRSPNATKKLNPGSCVLQLAGKVKWDELTKSALVSATPGKEQVGPVAYSNGNAPAAPRTTEGAIIAGRRKKRLALEEKLQSKKDIPERKRRRGHSTNSFTLTREIIF